MKFIFLLISFLLHVALFGQFGNGSDGIPVIGSNTIVNSYKKIQSTSGTTFTLLNTSAFSLSSGNVVLVINMLTGEYELRTVVSVSGTDVNLAAGTISNTVFANYSQMIKVPQFSNVSISAGNSITCPAWDGETGGVICFLVSNVLSLDAGEIDASNKGFFGGNGGIGGTGGLGGLGGFSGSNTSSSGLYGMGGSGINGAGNGGAYGDLGTNGTNGSLAFFNSTTTILPCGNAIASCNNTHNSNSASHLYLGDGGAGGNGGNGKTGAGGGGSNCATPGENGEIGGNGGNGGNGGIGGGIILIKAGSINHSNTLIKAMGSSGTAGTSATNGGVGGDGICGGGGGDGADGGNGGAGGHGGAGGAIKISKGGGAVNTSFVNVAGGSAMIGGVGGQGGLGGLNSNASCACGNPCDLSQLIPFLTHPNTIVSTVAGVTHFIFTLGDSILDLSYQDSINCIGNPIGILSGTLYENSIPLNTYYFKISSNTPTILANLIDFVLNDPPNLDTTGQTILTPSYHLFRDCTVCGNGYELPENGDPGIDGPSSTPGGNGYYDEECVAPVIPTGSSIYSICEYDQVTLSVSASGGTGSYSYQWYQAGGTLIPGANSPTFTPNYLSPGTYFYYCIITNLVPGGCSSQSELIQVNVIQPSYINIGPNQEICAGEIVNLSATVYGGGFPYSYTWSTSGDGTFTNVSPFNADYIPGVQDIANGSVVLTLTTSNLWGFCGYNVDLIYITINPNHVINSTVNICQGETYSFGGNNLTTAGNYTETFQSISGCDSTVNLTLVVNPTLSSSTNLSICQGSTTQFHGQTLSTSGTYTHTLQAVNGCDSVVTLNLIVNPLPFVSLPQLTTTCIGSPLTLSPSVNIPGGSYLWSNNETTQTILVYPITFTNYSVTYTLNGCSSTSSPSSGNIVVNPIPTVSVNNQTICAGQFATLTAVGIPANQGNFLWSTTETTASINVSPSASATYSVTYTVNSCPSNIEYATVTVNPVFNSSTNLDICQGSTTQFHGQTLSASGTYTHTLQAVNGCDSIVTLNLTVNPSFNSSVNLSICQGSSIQFNGQTLSTAGVYTQTFQSVNGCDSIVTLTLTVNPVYNSSSSLTICQGATTQFHGQTLSASGTYTHTLQAVNGCDSIVTLNLTVLSSSTTAFSSSIVQGNVSCQGDASGFIQLAVSGGIPSYNYLWSNGATTEDLTNLSAGSYSVLITDANGCSITNQTIITEPTSALSINGNQTNVGCFGGNNGIISISAQGGTPSYDYLWNNGQTTSTINGLSIGTYTVLVTDNLNCSTSMTFTISQPLGEMGLTSTVINTSCLNASTGSIDLSILNGTPTYIYSWSNGATTEDISSLPSGDYTVIVTDALGCAINATVTVEEPINPMIVTPTVSNLNCYGGSDAFISLAISGGVSPYDILWDNGETLPVIDSLSAGNYNVMVSDDQGCQTPLSFTIAQPAPIVASFNPSVTSGCSPLTVTFTNTSTGPFTNYSWNFGNGSTSSAANGSFTFTQPSCYNVSLIVSNAAGCADTLSADSLICVFAGPNASFVTSSGGIDFYSGQLALQNTSDGAISDYQWSFGDGSPNSSLENPIHYYPEEQVGTYLVILSVIDTNGCVDTTSYVFSLVENLSVYVPNTITINDDNINEVFLPVFSNVDILQSYQLEIFNRWGELIWETDIVSKGWNGRYKGNKDVQIGTYTWKIQYTDNASVSRIMLGHVNVIR